MSFWRTLRQLMSDGVFSNAASLCLGASRAKDPLLVVPLSERFFQLGAAEFWSPGA